MAKKKAAPKTPKSETKRAPDAAPDSDAAIKNSIDE